MTIYSGFSHEKWSFSIAMLVYQRVVASRLGFVSPRKTLEGSLEVPAPTHKCSEIEMK